MKMDDNINMIDTIILTILMVFSFTFTNFLVFVGTIAGIWLAMLGEWLLLGTGLFLALGGSHFIIAIPTTIVTLLYEVVALFVPKIKMKKAEELCKSLLEGITTHISTIVWCTIIIFYFGSYIGDENRIPLLIGIYTVTLAPSVYVVEQEMAKQNEEYKKKNDHTNTKNNICADILTYNIISVFFMQTGIIITLIGYMKYDFGVKEAIISQFIFHIFGIIMTMIMVLKERTRQKRLEL